MVKKDINDWRGRDIWALKLADISKVTVKPVPGKSFSVVVGEDAGAATFQLAENVQTPEGFRFGADEAKRLVNGLTSLRASAFFDGEAKAPETGLSVEHTTLTIERKEGKSINLHIGAENDKKQRFVEVEGNSQVYLIPSSSLKKYLGDVNSLRAMNLIDFDEKEIVKIQIVEGKNKTVLTKKENAWVIQQPKVLPDGFEFDPNSVARQLRSIKNTQAERYVGPSASSAHGFKKPGLEILVTDSKNKTHQLVFGAGFEDNGKKIFVLSPIDNGVYAARAFQKTRFEKGVALFKKFEAPKGDFSQAQGFNSLPPDVRKSLEEQMRKNQMFQK